MPNRPDYFDPKGDPVIVKSLYFLTHGQLPYGEWLKKLSATDRAPRGKCGRYFVAHRHFRR